jgi:hypothetical protein
VKDLLEEAEETEANVLKDEVEKINKAQDEADGKPHGYITEMHENISMEPVSEDELEDVFDDQQQQQQQPQVKVRWLKG